MKKYIVCALAAAFVLSAPQAMADKIAISAPNSVHPYIIPEENSGLELEIVREALALVGHELDAKFHPTARAISEYASGNVDGAMTTNEFSGLEGHFSDSHVTYETVAISMLSKSLQINSFEDLRDKKTISFQKASQYLGDGFGAVVTGNPNYREDNSSEIWASLLFSGRIDVVIAEKRIFVWATKSPSVTSKVDASQELAFHSLFPETPYKIVFRNEAHRDDFNRGLKMLKESGRYDEIASKYAL